MTTSTEDNKKYKYVCLETGKTLHLAQIIGEVCNLNDRIGMSDLTQSLNRMNSKLFEITAKTMEDDNCRDTQDFMLGIKYFLDDITDVSIHYDKILRYERREQ